MIGSSYLKPIKNPDQEDEGDYKYDMEGRFIVFIYILDKPGSDLLSRALRQSTIGAERLNDRVRNGIGWGPLAITTRLMQDI